MADTVADLAAASGGPSEGVAETPPLNGTPIAQPQQAVGMQDLSPSNPFSDQERLQIGREQRRSQGPGVDPITAVQDALQAEWSLMWVGTEINRPDPDFVMSKELLTELTEGVPTEYIDYFGNAHSEAHARKMREDMLKDLEVEQRLSSMGWGGTALRLVAAVADPVGIAAGIATGGAGFALKGARITRALKTGAVAAPAAAGVETLLSQAKPTGDMTDILHASVSAFALGSVIGGLSRGVDQENLVLGMLADKSKRDIERAAGNPSRTPEDAPQEPVRDVEGEAPDDSVGAARAPGVTEPINSSADERLRDAYNAPQTAMGRVRFDAVGQLKSSKNPIARKLGDLLGEDAVGNADGSTNIFGASEFQQFEMRRMETKFYKEVGSDFNDWAKENNLNWWQRQRRRGEFMQHVTRAIRDDFAEVPSQARAAASKMSAIYDEWLELARNPGLRDGRAVPSVKGFENVERNPHYVTRIYSPQKMSAMIEKYGSNQIGRLFSEAMTALRPEIDRAVADKYGAWMVQKIRAYQVGSDISMTRALAGEDYDTLREMLRRDGALDHDQIETMIDQLRKPLEGSHSRAKHRLKMDERYHTRLTPKYGGEAEDVRIEDLLENDIETLFHVYNRQLSGAVALGRAGFASRGELETAIKHLRESSTEIPGYTRAEMEADVANLEYLGTSVSGSPIGSFGQAIFDGRATTLGKAARLVRDYNFMRVMNQVGMAQLAEIGNVLGQVGVKAALENLPAFRSFLRDARSGKLRDELADEIEDIWGIGSDNLRHVVANRWDDFGTAIDPHEGRFMNRADTLLGYGKRITADVSGMSAINTALHRWVAKALVGKFADMAHGGRKWSKARLQSSGIEPEMLDRIGAQIRTHASTVDGQLTRAKVRRINLDDWDDVDAAEAFRMGVFRLARRIVQENDAGNMNRWFSRTLGQTIVQFRTFMLVSWAKQTLHGVHVNDRNTYASWAMSMFAAGMAYVAQTAANSAGRSDADEYLDERLSVESIAAASFQRAGFASLLPMGIDTVSGMLGQDPIFDYRSTGLSNQFLGNPTIDLADRTFNGIRGLGRVMFDSDYELTQQTARQMWGVLPFQNAAVIRNVQNLMVSGLPTN